MARPKAKIDLTELEKLCAMQCTDEEIGAFFGVSSRTIERRRKVQRFSDVMEQAKAKGKVSVRRNLFRLAGNGNVAAAIFLAQEPPRIPRRCFERAQRARWKADFDRIPAQSFPPLR